MAQPLQSINLVAPAFMGINSEDSPIAQDPSYAAVADNAIIDKRGRIAARQGITLLTNNGGEGTALDNTFLAKVHYYAKDGGEDECVLSAGNNKIFKGTDTLEDITPSGYTISADDWQIFTFNDKAYFYQRGHDPLVYDGSSLKTFTDVNGEATPDILRCHAAIGAYGRVWAASSNTERQTVYWSDLLIGNDFDGGSSGSINVGLYWPDGADEIVGLAAHNGFLIIFGKHSIITYGNAENVLGDAQSGITLDDAISGVGCFDRNSIQHTGSDLLFMSDNGLRALGRVIEEKSLPLSDLSGNVKTDLISYIERRQAPVATVYSPENSFYLVTFLDEGATFCFDLKGKLENGAFRVTRWPSYAIKSFERAIDGTLYVGTTGGLSIYRGYSDNNQSYRFRYYSPSLTFDDASKLKMLKKIIPTIVGADTAEIFIKWGYDFTTSFSNATVKVGNAGLNVGYLNESEFDSAAEFTGGVTTSRLRTNTTGSGSTVMIGIESNINGEALSIQEINVQALTGRIV